MNDERWNPGAAAERRQLLVFAIGASVVAAAMLTLTARHVLPAVLLGLAVLAAAGVVAHRWIGRGIYLLFVMLAGLIGAVVSRVMVALAYLFAIAGFGSLLRAVRVNRLNRDFEACRRKDTMLMEAPLSDEESFRRQS